MLRIRLAGRSRYAQVAIRAEISILSNHLSVRPQFEAAPGANLAARALPVLAVSMVARSPAVLRIRTGAIIGSGRPRRPAAGLLLRRCRVVKFLALARSIAGWLRLWCAEGLAAALRTRTSSEIGAARTGGLRQSTKSLRDSPLREAACLRPR